MRWEHTDIGTDPLLLVGAKNNTLRLQDDHRDKKLDRDPLLKELAPRGMGAAYKMRDL